MFIVQHTIVSDSESGLRSHLRSSPVSYTNCHSSLILCSTKQVLFSLCVSVSAKNVCINDYISVTSELDL